MERWTERSVGKLVRPQEPFLPCRFYTTQGMPGRQTCRGMKGRDVGGVRGALSPLFVSTCPRRPFPCPTLSWLALHLTLLGHTSPFRTLPGKASEFLGSATGTRGNRQVSEWRSCLVYHVRPRQGGRRISHCPIHMPSSLVGRVLGDGFIYGTLVATCKLHFLFHTLDRGTRSRRR